MSPATIHASKLAITESIIKLVKAGPVSSERAIIPTTAGNVVLSIAMIDLEDHVYGVAERITYELDGIKLGYTSLLVGREDPNQVAHRVTAENNAENIYFLSACAKLYSDYRLEQVKPQ